MPPQEQQTTEKRKEGDVTIEKVSLRDFGGGSGTPEERLVALERAVENILRTAHRINGVIHFVSQDADPSKANEGDVCVVGGKLKIYTSSAWVVVGTQT